MNCHTFDRTSFQLGVFLGTFGLMGLQFLAMYLWLEWQGVLGNLKGDRK